MKKPGQTLTYETLSVAQLQSILSLQKTVIEALPDQRVLQPLSEEEFLFILNGNGLMIGLFDQGELIAFRALLAPPVDAADHLGKDFRLSGKELANVIYQEISVVHPDYRGQNLQKKMASFIMKELETAEHPYRYVCCTVAPFNIPSLKDKFAQGMKIVSMKAKYGGHLRYTFMKEIGQTATRYSHAISVPMADTERQQELLGQGMYGVGMALEKKEWVLFFVDEN